MLFTLSAVIPEMFALLMSSTTPSMPLAPPTLIAIVLPLIIIVSPFTAAVNASPTTAGIPDCQLSLPTLFQLPAIFLLNIDTYI